MDLQSAAGLSRDLEIAAHAPDQVLHDIETDATPGDVRDGVLEREARQKEELQQLDLGELVRDRRQGQMPLQMMSRTSPLDAGAVVGDRDQQQAGAVARFEANGAFAGLPACRRCSTVSQP